jgi:phosphoribosyl 1,2-cyclic phosphodiesterase
VSIRFQVLASGSKGNAILICSERTSLLLDSGLSGRELARRMECTEVAPKQLTALLVSHEHRDHVQGIGVLSRRYDLPIFLSKGTLEGLPQSVGTLASVQVFQTGRPFTIGDLSLYAFPISHDAREPVGFVVEHNGSRLGICTDLGIATQLVKTRLQSCQGLVLEANHDPTLLHNGPYPWHLKQRIKGRHGHLSNAESCALLEELHHDQLQAVVLAHLSEINNRPDIVAGSIGQLSQPEKWRPVCFEIATQDQPARGFEI